MRKRMELIAVIIAIVGLVWLSKNLESYMSSGKVKSEEKTVVLDAGHGGRDAGKVGVNGALEKDINLAIAKMVKKELEKKDVRVIMTRKKDECLAKEPSGNQKIQDMRERVELINKSKPALAVSIHQNSFHQSDVKGAQVFFFTHSAQGEKDAAIMQDILQTVDKDNTKQPKANDTYYLLKKTEAPLLIVECGFLSNPEEAERLSDEEYQKQMAKAIADGILACLQD